MEEKRVNTESIATDLPAWDEAAALEIAGGNLDLARELVQMLVRGLPQDLSDLRRCFQANDWPLLTTTAHRMRGATSYCGVPALDAHLKALEDSAKAGDRERIDAELTQVVREAERLTRTMTPTA
ncbi:Hpt domain-containing protein [Candidatus Thiosymbion oneisti]|uniref:Hpt domain-containing protein n=1 Tax=Candidatus Thiosymbion oneisti TaxID=589554 RepID=UPI00105ECC36|nr:Hpt domain-containing protein [Candidatus Thiosymbion oneisti]